MPVILLSELKITKNAQAIEEYFEQQTKKGLEGIMAKKLDGIYRAGARDFNWIKYKKSYSSKLSDTIDVVVMGYDLGQGKRTGFGIGDFLIGIHNDKKEVFETVSKIGTGLTDMEWKELKRKAESVKRKDKPNNYDVDKMMECDVWIRPSIIVEIRADEITRSPVHTAGRIMVTTKSGNAQEVKEAGYALRFPRLERFRDDRKPENITSLSEVEKMYKQQGR